MININRTKLYHHTLIKNLFNKYVLTSRSKRVYFLVLRHKKKIRVFKTKNLKKEDIIMV